MIKNNITEMVGNTVLLKLNKMMEKYNIKANIYAKIEKNNPAGSIKDRAALSIYQQAIGEKKITKETIIIEPTSGNTGIAFASIARYYGNQVIIVMPSNMSIERVKILKAYGAKVVLTPSELGMKGAIEEAQRISEENKNSFIPSQFVNKFNKLAHYKNTAVEIANDLKNKIDYFIAGIGTGGTISGCGEYFKENCPNTKVIGIEPFESSFITTGYKGPHKIQGIGAGFIPELLNLKVIDEIITVKSEDALKMFRELAFVEGLFCGISSAANLVGVINYIKEHNIEQGNVVTVFPDSGERYLSMMED